MGKTLAYITRVLFAVPARILREAQRPLRSLESFQVVSPGLATGHHLLENLEESQPDMLVLDMTLPGLDKHEVLIALSAKKLRPYVVAIAPLHDPDLLDIRKYPAVRAALTESLALSPLLRYVLEGVAEGCQYFAASPPIDQPNSGLNPDETLLLALMVIGRDALDAMHELKWPKHKVYNSLRSLRKKLHVDTSGQVIAYAIRHGLVGVLTERPNQQSYRETA